MHTCGVARTSVFRKAGFLGEGWESWGFVAVNEAAQKKLLSGRSRPRWGQQASHLAAQAGGFQSRRGRVLAEGAEGEVTDETTARKDSLERHQLQSQISARAEPRGPPCPKCAAATCRTRGQPTPAVEGGVTVSWGKQWRDLWLLEGRLWPLEIPFSPSLLLL